MKKASQKKKKTRNHQRNKIDYKYVLKIFKFNNILYCGPHMSARLQITKVSVDHERTEEKHKEEKKKQIQ